MKSLAIYLIDSLLIAMGRPALTDYATDRLFN